jgi:predicted ester cyclase
MAAVPAAFAELRLAVDDLVAGDDKAAVRWTLTGTHRGAFGPYPPTGKQVTLTGIAIVRVANGQVAEGWGCFDTLSAMQQLGATVTLPGQAIGQVDQAGRHHGEWG